jgi:hypothetical protein
MAMFEAARAQPNDIEFVKSFSDPIVSNQIMSRIGYCEQTEVMNVESTFP